MAKSEEARASTFKISLIGGETLLGKDIQETLANRSRTNRIATFSANGEGAFGQEDGEAVYIEPFSAKSLAEENLLVLAGSEAGARLVLGVVETSDRKPVLIDALGYLNGAPGAKLVSTLPADVHPAAGERIVFAHPAASALSLLLQRLAKYQVIQHANADVLAPASERGQQGIDELHKQTTALLAFKPLPKKVFDAQLAFNLLARLGGEAAMTLASTEERIHSEMRLLVPAIPVSLRLVQASVFHGYSISLFIEFSQKANRESIEEALACAQIEVRTLGEETPDVVSAASSGGLIVGDIRIDRGNPKAVWLWVVFDNLRLLSDAIADIASALRQEELV